MNGNCQLRTYLGGMNHQGIFMCLRMLFTPKIDGWLVVSNMAFIFHNIWDNPSH